MGELELLDQLQVGGGFLEGGEVLTVEVLDQRLLDGADVVSDTHDRRNRRQPGAPRRPPTPLPGDQLVPVGDTTHEDRLQQAELGDRVSQFAERLLVEVDPRLVGIGGDVGDGDLGERRRPVECLGFGARRGGSANRVPYPIRCVDSSWISLATSR